MLLYYTIPLFLYAFRALSLSITSESFKFAEQYNHQLNYTSTINQTDRRYHIDCRKISRPHLPTPNPAACGEVKRAACEPFDPDFPFPIVRDRWAWLTLKGCSLAFYIPADADVSLYPSVYECQEKIYGAMIRTCVHNSGQYNIGTINVNTPPDPNFEGSPLVHGHPRYLMAYEELDE